MLVKTGFWQKDRTGRLVLKGDTFGWEDGGNSKENFTFETTGLEKVWYTCDARSSGNFCHQINFKIVKGDRYKFRDINRESGSNAAVTKIMEALRTYYPRLSVLDAERRRLTLRSGRARNARPRRGPSGFARGDAMVNQEARGKVKKVQGRVKEAAGIITGNSALEQEGSRQRAEGAVQESVGKARRKVGELVDGVAKAIKK